MSTIAQRIAVNALGAGDPNQIPDLWADTSLQTAIGFITDELKVRNKGFDVLHSDSSRIVESNIFVVYHPLNESFKVKIRRGDFKRSQFDDSDDTLKVKAKEDVFKIFLSLLAESMPKQVKQHLAKKQ